MPLPLLLWGTAIAAGGLGAIGHSAAKDTNEKAQNLSRKAEKIYDEAKDSLEAAQKRTENALMTLGTAKKNVLETSIAQFLRVYENVPKNIRIAVKDSKGINEAEKLRIAPQDVVKLRTGALSAAGGLAVLGELCGYFVPCVNKLEHVIDEFTRKREAKNKDYELALCAVSLSLAGAVKRD